MTLHSRGWNIGFWVLQVLLAALFGMAGLAKISQPIDELVNQMSWVASAPNLTRFIGAAEFAGALGLILPTLTRVKPLLAIWASLGLVAIMVLAVLFHLQRGETTIIPVNLMLGSFAALVAWGRSRKAPVIARI